MSVNNGNIVIKRRGRNVEIQDVSSNTSVVIEHADRLDVVRRLDILNREDGVRSFTPWWLRLGK